MDIKKRLIFSILRMTVKKNFKKGINYRALRKFDRKITEYKAGPGILAEHVNAEGTDVLVMSPEHLRDERVIVYLHGGGFVSGPSDLQLKLIERLAAETSYRAFSVFYSLAPECSWREIHDGAAAAFKYIEDNYPGASVAAVGDSAGAGLALSYTMSCLKEGDGAPAALVLMSPWLDVSTANESITDRENRTDPVLGLNGLRAAGLIYRRELPADDYRVSPLYGDLRGLPELLVMSGSRDMLVHDSRLFVRKCRDAGVKIDYSEYADMPHVWMIMPDLFSEAEDAFREAADFISNAGRNNRRSPK